MCGGAAHLDVPGSTIGAVLRELDRRCPGIYERVVEDGHLRPELAFAIDGEVIGMALHDAVRPGAEIAIVPAIGGG
jgi:molybdopterin converting factor small subunit